LRNKWWSQSWNMAFLNFGVQCIINYTMTVEWRCWVRNKSALFILKHWHLISKTIVVILSMQMSIGKKCTQCESFSKWNTHVGIIVSSKFLLTAFIHWGTCADWFFCEKLHMEKVIYKYRSTFISHLINRTTIHQ
jgi:hypothetical protein